jgi:hypothetical protein
MDILFKHQETVESPHLEMMVVWLFLRKEAQMVSWQSWNVLQLITNACRKVFQFSMVSSTKDCKKLLDRFVENLHMSIALWISWRCFGVATG